jgi:hypothetical protein
MLLIALRRGISSYPTITVSILAKIRLGKLSRYGHKPLAMAARGFNDETMIPAQHLRLLACHFRSLAKLGQLGEQLSETSSDHDAAIPPPSF